MKKAKDKSVDFYLPVVLPPLQLIPTNAISYYNIFEALGVTVTAASPGPGAPLEITVGKADVNHLDGVTPVSTVFASTSGFVSYSQGDLLLGVWGPDFAELAKPAGGLRPNRIVFGGLDSASIESAAAKQVAQLALAVLRESWTEANGSSAVPERPALEAALLQRFMAGTAAIFVRHGTPLGTGATTSSAGGLTAKLTLQTFFDPWGADPAVNVPPEDFIDNALAEFRLLRFAGHPLIKAISGPITVHFTSRFFIWDNDAYGHVPFANGQVTLLAGAPVPTTVADLVPTVPVATAITDGGGRIALTAPLPARAMIRFRCATAGRTYGSRLFIDDIRTEAHRARLHLDVGFNNSKDYRAKYEIYPQYQEFLDDIAGRGGAEMLEEDRGNANLQDHSLGLLGAEALAVVLPGFLEIKALYSPRDRLEHIAATERFYRRDVIPPKASTFNLLVEGDSWLNYPLASNDIYSNLDQIFFSRLKPGVAYNRIPLQHLGDRSDHMFHSLPGKRRQWDFTDDFLKEYRIDLILCSAGGNDFAEPGFNHGFDEEPYKSLLTESYFDPFLAQGSLTAAEMAVARRVMLQSFSVLLRNHRWNLFIRNPTAAQLDGPAMTAVLDPLLAALGVDFGPSPADLVALGIPPGPVSDSDAPQVLQPIGDKVIANFPDTVTPGSAAQMLLDFVFDRTTGSTTGFYEQRYAQVKSLWEVLLTRASGLGIPVVSHTYCYPLFNEHPASPLGWGNYNITGPWFRHRFLEANISDRRVEKICLKALLDDFVTVVLAPLKSQFPLFDYVDVRRLNASTEVWRDEMHLRAKGFKRIAEQIYSVVAANPKLSQFFMS